MEYEERLATAAMERHFNDAKIMSSSVPRNMPRMPSVSARAAANDPIQPLEKSPPEDKPSVRERIADVVESVEKTVDGARTAKRVSDEIDADATSAACVEALRAVGKNFVASPKERTELRKIVAPKADAARNRMDMALILVVIVMGMVLISRRKASSEANT